MGVILNCTGEDWVCAHKAVSGTKHSVYSVIRGLLQNGRCLTTAATEQIEQF